MNRTPIRPLALVVLLLVGSVLCHAIEVGDDAPKFANPDLGGRYVRHATVVGAKWVIVNFFATWCEPCKEELPELEALQKEVGTDDLQIIVFATDKEKAKVKEFFQKRPTNLTILLDPYQMAYQRYNDPKDGIPTIFLVDKQGKLAMAHVGFDPEFIAKMRETILEGNE